MIARLSFWCILVLCILYGCNKPAVSIRQSFSIPPASVPADSLLKLGESIRANRANSRADKKAYAALVMGLYYNKTGAYRQAQKEFNDGLQLLKEIPDSILIARTWLGLGNSSKNLGEYPEALSFFTKALDFYEKVNDLTAQATVHADIGQVFQLENDLPQATSHLNTAVHLLGNQKKSVTYLIALHTLANVHGMYNQLDSALLLDKEGLAIARELNLPEQSTPFLDNMATCFTLRNQFDSARSLYYQCLAIDQTTGNKKQVADTWLNLGMLEEVRHHNAQAVEYIDTSLKQSAQIGYRLGQMIGWQAMSRLHKDNKQLEKALEAQSKYFALKDSILNEKKENAIAEWKAIYETEKKEKEIRLKDALLQKKKPADLFSVHHGSVGFAGCLFCQPEE